MDRLLAICFAGALGTGARYLLGLWAGERFGAAFPYGTLIVNTAGCFLMALVMQVAVLRTNMPETLRLALTTGFMGGLTTYSSFNYETTHLLQNGAYTSAAVNLGATLLACFAAGALGMLLARAIAA